jgi:hypothetical protein
MIFALWLLIMFPIPVSIRFYALMRAVFVAFKKRAPGGIDNMAFSKDPCDKDPPLIANLG